MSQETKSNSNKVDVSKLEDYIIDAISEDFGYEVLSLGVINAKGVQRPSLKDNDNDVEVKYAPDGDSIKIKDYSAKHKEYGFYQIPQGTINVKGFQALKKAPEGVAYNEESDKERLENFKKRRSKVNIKKSKESPEWLQKKGLKLLSGEHFTSKSSDVFNTKNDQPLKGIIIDFFDPETKEVKGSQLRLAPKEGNRNMFTIAESNPIGCIHVIQTGMKNKIIKKNVAVLVESWSTGLELAEALPNDTVICTMGNGSLEGVYNKLKSLPEYDIIIVALDKPIKSREGTEKAKTVEKVIKWAKEPKNRIVHIIPDSVSVDYHDCTDFNDVCKIMGKRRFGKYLNGEINKCLPYSPNPLSFDGENFQVLGGLDNEIHKISYKCTTDELLRVMHISTLSPFYSSKDYSNLFMSQLKLNRNLPHYGVGIFHEDKSKVTVLNLYGERWVYNIKEKSIRPMYESRIDENIYMNQKTPDGIAPMKEDLSIEGSFGKSLMDLTESYRKLTHNSDSSLLPFLGWIVQASYAGILKRRAHLWLTGATGRGKTTLASYILQFVIPDSSKWFSGGTVTGMRQDITGNIGTSCPVVGAEEVIGKSEKAKKSLEELLELLKNVATNNGSVTPYGKSDQIAISTVQKFAACLVSTSAKFNDLQERSRFCLISPAIIKKDLNGKSFDQFEEDCKKVREPFLSFLARNAHKAKGIIYEVQTELNKKYPRISEFQGHQSSMIASVLMGCVLLLREMDGNQDISVEEIFDDFPPALDKFVQYQIEKMEEFVSGEDIIKEILLSSIRTDGFSCSIYKLLAGDCSEEYKTTLGLSLSEDKKALYLHSKGSLSKFDNQKEIVKPIYDIQNRLGNEYPTEWEDRVSIRTSKGPRKLYAFPIPEKIQELIILYAADERAAI